MISIITPCLNSKDTIRTTIESVISQNDCSIEYIVVDGGSTDGTLNIIREYADSIHLITGKDKSIADAMNKGIRASSGDIVGILNDDDVYHDGALAEVERVHRQHPNSVLHGDMDVVFPNSYLKYVARSPSNPNFKLGMVINHPTMFVPKSILDKFGHYDDSLKITGDWDLCLRYVACDVNFFKIDKSLVTYLVGGLSTIAAEQVFNEMHTLRKRYKLYHYFDFTYVKHLFLSKITLGKIIYLAHLKRAILHTYFGL